MAAFTTALIASGFAGLGAGSIGGGALIISGAYAGITTGTLALAQVLSAVVTVGASVGLNAALGLLNKPKNTQQNKITIKQPLPARFIDFGRVRSGGCIAWFFSPDHRLVTVRIITCTKIEQLEVFYLDDYACDAATVNTGVVSNSTPAHPWDSFAYLQMTHGADDQVAIPLAAEIAEWGSTRRLRGMAAFCASYAQGNKDNWSQRYPNGAPNPTFVIKGAMVPDPRNPAHDLEDQSTWTYSDNWARCFLRWCLDRDGWGLSPDDLDLDSFEAACDDCDASVATTTGTEPRYLAWGRYTTSDTRASTLANFLASAGATLLEQPNGKLAVFVGKDRTPNSATDITDEHIRDVQLDRFPDALDRVDGIRARITWQYASWEEQEVPAVYSGASFYGAQADVDDLPLAYCPSPYQAQRIAYATLKQRRADWSGTIKTTLQGLRCYGEPVVRLTISELGIDGEIFEITSPPALDLSDMSVSIGVRSYAAGTWSMPGAEMQEMGETATNPQDFTVPEPEGLGSSVSTLTVTVTWDTISGEDAYTTEAQWRVAAGVWVAATASAGTGSFTVPSAGTYEFQCRRVSDRGYVSDWAVLTGIVVI
ncbi:hypothetical protein [Ancylobacter radicis]|uniref:Tip attachment protein J domain-containing protein n=1 Tax=Ancylobacter radicis TaxID=2836179 RepID=A0ABS5R3Q7_9HYPH|nr:hypothetical protein [Ancylobacter radicis]MBS9476246.1 hypothetical protein [Ancylobacter radicis]